MGSLVYSKGSYRIGSVVMVTEWFGSGCVVRLLVLVVMLLLGEGQNSSGVDGEAGGSKHSMITAS